VLTPDYQYVPTPDYQYVPTPDYQVLLTWGLNKLKHMRLLAESGGLTQAAAG
jgi:hypothetical protein